MQTFLPYPDFKHSADCLDNRRLGKQRLECKQIVNCLLGNSSGWKNHPAVKMWEGYLPALLEYSICICEEWIARGYKDSLLPVFRNWAEHIKTPLIYPPWLGNDAFHASHRSNLLRKYEEWYRQFCWTEGPELPYVWPAK